MPHMQRITWSGIALHGGPLPGYPASHGCVRMPFDFAARLFEGTRMGLRVIVAPTDVAPIEIAHQALLKPKPDVIALAAARRADADEAAGKADQARLAAAKAYRESTQAMMPVRVADNLKRRAETQLAAAETALGSATSPESKEQAERTKAQAAARIAELQEQWAAAKAELQPKLDAVTAAREAALAAENARIAAVEAARQAARELEQVSVLISRKNQRLYVRRAFEPILESPVTIQDPDRPIGTHVFTAVEQTDGGTGIRWNVVSLEGSRPNASTVESHDSSRGHRRHEVEPKKTEPASAMAALDRIVIPQDVLDRIAGITPRSSLIITDEALSSETGKGTEFVVVLSGEPQGGIKMRRRAPQSEFPYARARDRRPFWSPPIAGPFSTW
jgi:L,D-transpeptidase catalytic domain